MWLWFNRPLFFRTFLCFFTGLNLFFIITLYYPPVASLFRLNLTNADLRGRNLARAKNLTWANLNGAVLEDTDLRGTDLGNAVGLTLDQLAVAHTDEHTILPEYIKSQIAAAAKIKMESIQNGEPWSEDRSTLEERVIDLDADVLFGSDKTEIPAEAIPLLKKLVTAIQQSGDGLIQLNGHTDSKGSDSYNQDLSERRALAVKEWLSTYGGIDSKRLETKGYGRTQPITSDTKKDGSDDPEGRAKNRRVEIRIPKTQKLVTSVR